MTDTTGPAAQPSSAPRVASRDSGWRWLPLAALIIGLDQWAKGFIERHFELYQTQFVLPVLDIVRAHNKGAAFSFLADAGGWQRWVFTALALGVSAAIVWWLRGVDARSQPALAAGLALIQGGAIGNVIDRIEHGYVVDFIQVHWAGAYFPAFNVADSAITVGAGLLILDAIIEWRRERARVAQR